MSLVKADIVKNISTKTHLTASDSRDLLESFLSIIKDNIHSSKVKISNFGTFESKTSPQRLGRNPRTKEPHLIPKRNRLIFTASSALKNHLN